MTPRARVATMPKPERLTRGTDGHDYRGFRIALNRTIPAGRLGRYSAGGREFAQLEHARSYIDEELAMAG